MLSQNAGEELPFYAAKNSKRGQLTNQLYSFLCCSPSCCSVQTMNIQERAHFAFTVALHFDATEHGPNAFETVAMIYSSDRG